MAYTKLEADGTRVEVSEQEHLKEFFDSVQELQSGKDGSLPGMYCFNLFTYMLKWGNLPDTLRKRVLAVMNTAFYKALLQCEECFAPKQKEYTVDVSVAPTFFGMKVKATSKEEAEELVQKTLDGRSLDADTVLSVTNAVLSSVVSLEANEDEANAGKADE